MCGFSSLAGHPPASLDASIIIATNTRIMREVNANDFIAIVVVRLTIALRSQQYLATQTEVVGGSRSRPRVREHDNA